MRRHKPAFPHRVLIDTSAYFAFADRDDTYHSAAQAIFTHLAHHRTRLFTTDSILAEADALQAGRGSGRYSLRPGIR